MLLKHHACGVPCADSLLNSDDEHSGNRSGNLIGKLKVQSLPPSRSRCLFVGGGFSVLGVRVVEYKSVQLRMVQLYKD